MSEELLTDSEAQLAWQFNRNNHPKMEVKETKVGLRWVPQWERGESLNDRDLAILEAQIDKLRSLGWVDSRKFKVLSPATLQEMWEKWLYETEMLKKEGKSPEKGWGQIVAQAQMEQDKNGV